jgi:putative copper export protein
MQNALYIAGRVIRLLAYAVWMGGIVFFGMVVAPGAAHIFGTTERFADFIGHNILMLHAIGMWCGIAMLVGLRMLNNRAYRPIAQGAIILFMIVMTFVSNRAIVLPMEHDRMLAGGNISVLLSDSPLRQDFDARHKWSTTLESTILFAGLALGVLIGFEAGLQDRIATAPPRKVFDLSSDE